ncbi:MAG: sirohydrochlorin chelatase [Myxococcota bacterium]
MRRALLVVDHGSREPEAAAHLARLAAELRERRPELAVYVAHLELATPSIAEAIARCAADGVSDLVVHPFFLAPGRHAARDVPRAVEAAAAAHPGLRVRVSAPFGAAAGIADLILATLSPE